MNEEMGTVLDRHLDAALERIHTAIPARVESYTAQTRKVSAKPLIRLRLTSGPLIEIPVIADIPVVFPSSAAFSLDYPLAAGDIVLLVFSEASLGNWLSSPGTAPVDPEDGSRFSLTDAIAIPGLYPFGAVPDSQARISVGADGTMLLKSGSGCTAEFGPDKITLNGNLEVLK